MAELTVGPDETGWSHTGLKTTERCSGRMILSAEIRLMAKGELTRRKTVATAAPIFNQGGFEGSSP